jgi:hypothetical protein
LLLPFGQANSLRRGVEGECPLWSTQHGVPVRDLPVHPCRWFVLKQGKVFWFKSDAVTQESVPRGVIEVGAMQAFPHDTHGCAESAACMRLWLMELRHDSYG